MDEALNLENRRKIYRYVSKHPGAYLREMEREGTLTLVYAARDEARNNAVVLKGILGEGAG